MADPVPGTLDFAARMNPQAEALVDAPLRRTWNEWDERACRLGSFLRERFDLRRGDRVAWMMFNRAEHFDLVFALSKIGAVAVPIGFRLTGSEAAYIIQDSDAKTVFCEARFAPRLAGALAEMPDVSEDHFVVVGQEGREGALPKAVDFEAAIDAGSPERFVAETQTPAGSMIYTSGTTGRPKGAYRDGSEPRIQEGLRDFLLGIVAGFGYAPPEKHLVCCPLYHSAPPVFANITQLLGGSVVVMRRFDPEETLRTIQDEGIVSSFLVPTILNRILALPEQVLARYDLSSMKRLIVGAAPFPVELRRRTMELFPNPCLYEFYGATETGVNTIIGPEEHLRKPGSCGRATPGNEIRILDDEGKEVPVGEVGTLYVRNPILISRYHKNQKATQESLRDGYFTVGDMARVDEDGYYFIVDRKKDMIISGGVNIYPAEIEIELHRHPAVYDCAVIGVPNEEWGEEVKALVQLKPGARATAEELQEFLGQRLADYKRPRSVDFVDELPYNPTGKLLKRELRRRYWEAAGRSI